MLTVQIRIMSINRGEQLHSEPSIMSLLSLVDIPFLLILHLLCLSMATPYQSVLHSSLTSQETAHPSPCSRLMRSTGGRSEGRKGGVGVSPLKWQELGDLLSGSRSALVMVWGPQAVLIWPSYNLHLDYRGQMLSWQHPD